MICLIFRRTRSFALFDTDVLNCDWSNHFVFLFTSIEVSHIKRYVGSLSLLKPRPGKKWNLIVKNHFFIFDS